MTDAHCHPENLLAHNPNAEEERRAAGIAALASSTTREEFEYHEALAAKAAEEGAAPLYLSFAIHPQFPAFIQSSDTAWDKDENLHYLARLALEDRLHTIGETGFDLFDNFYKSSEKLQDEIFDSHLEIALKHNLPLKIHLRRAMHKIFPYTKELKKLPAIILHSWPGSAIEGEALIKRGINAYFSFGSTVLKNHKKAIVSAASLPPERLLLETDAPYQPLYGKTFSSYSDLNLICQKIAELRLEAGSPCNSALELEEKTTENFFGIFTSN